ncbi:DUF885 domain-containing protein [Antarcticibacterium arcticum]|uniref:DUF885 domain-containing protein n=1 Tax=Antarcticibacterium arcticum TaxID=2585771 RepID=A0A5B8YKT0_9FLAO|nr:DUF885 domain-containing protein [Antarcticibacterium arcticum]QED38221.1 DUF885 domain-containing protein [Antarcticibacterium arcticum]
MKFPPLYLFFLILLTAPNVIAQNDSYKLNEIITQVQDRKSYDKTEYPLGIFTKDHYRREAQFAKERLEKLKELKKENLTSSERISAELLKFRLQETVDKLEYEAYLNPLLSDAGFHVSLAYQVRELANYAQVKSYLAKLNAVPVYVDQHLALLREGIYKGITQPKVIFQGYEATYNDQIVKDYRDSFYYTPFKNLPQSLTKAQRDSVLKEAEIAIKNKVIPQFKRIKQFFETEYLPKARESVGVSAIPNGRKYYQNRLDFYTTLDLTAEEVHRIGLDEEARINSEMKTIIEEVEFDGSFEEFIQFLRTDEQFYAKSPEELLMVARNISKKIDAQLPRYFKTLPRKPYGVAPVPDAIAPKYTTGRYISPQDETQAGFYWVNTYDLPSRPLYVLPSLTAHEAVPGHHLQISLNGELGDSIPSFRRNFYLSAYGEGWGLYSEFLAEEMGIYTTPYELFGKLTYEQWRACRLVVDTGMHALGWSREEAVEYLRSNTALSLHEINTEIDRYISWPGQAVSYKIGEIKIRELRKKAEEELGEKFDIRDFHEVILSRGTLTLEIMEELVDEYIQTRLETGSKS